MLHPYLYQLADWQLMQGYSGSASHKALHWPPDFDQCLGWHNCLLLSKLSLMWDYHLLVAAFYKLLVICFAVVQQTHVTYSLHPACCKGLAALQVHTGRSHDDRPQGPAGAAIHGQGLRSITTSCSSSQRRSDMVQQQQQTDADV